MMQKEYLIKAVEIAANNIEEGGGPFGAVIVKDGEIIAESGNRVTANNDPTAHAEVMAIRLAGEKLGTYELSDCIMYASCEPCPMCLGAIYWSHIKEVYFAASREDAARAGFDDKLIYDELALDIENRSITMKKVAEVQGTTVFRLWEDIQDKLPY